MASHSLPDLGIDSNGICELLDGHTGSQATFSVQNPESFSTGTHLPMGILKSKNDNDTWLWQINHNAAWKWEVDDFKDKLYLAMGSLKGVCYDLKLALGPGESFTTVGVAMAQVFGAMVKAIAPMTSYRQRIKRPQFDYDQLPIIFNDYTNCLMGDPDEEKISCDCRR